MRFPFTKQTIVKLVWMSLIALQPVSRIQCVCVCSLSCSLRVYRGSAEWKTFMHNFPINFLIIARRSLTAVKTLHPYTSHAFRIPRIRRDDGMKSFFNVHNTFQVHAKHSILCDDAYCLFIFFAISTIRFQLFVKLKLKELQKKSTPSPIIGPKKFKLYRSIIISNQCENRNVSVRFDFIGGFSIVNRQISANFFQKFALAIRACVGFSLIKARLNSKHCVHTPWLTHIHIHFNSENRLFYHFIQQFQFAS